MIKLHINQKKLLKFLTTHTKYTFDDMCKYIKTKHHALVWHHLKQLIDKGMVQKIAKGRYVVTTTKEEVLLVDRLIKLENNKLFKAMKNLTEKQQEQLLKFIELYY